METKTKRISTLLDQPIWQLTGREFCELAQFAAGQKNETTRTDRQYIIGVRELAHYLGCCEATIYALKREGILDEAVVSQIGKRIVFDGEKARHAADIFQKQKRRGDE